MGKILFPLLIALGFGLLYLVSNPQPNVHYNYTSRIAEEFLGGRLGIRYDNPPHLNEFVPWGDRYYSVFPLGAVFTMLPLVVLGRIGIRPTAPEFIAVGLCAALSALLVWKLAAIFELRRSSRLILIAFLLCGTWMWTNLTFAGAWQIALGFAVVFELAALCMTFARKPSPFWAGFFYAFAFGNRTEVLLTAPLFLFLFYRRGLLSWRTALTFCLTPAILGSLTLAYNWARFGNPFDFGYAHIPGVLREYCYRHGIFSWRYIPYNIDHMLLQGWKHIPVFPYRVPSGFGGSILFASPFLLLLFWKCWRPSIEEKTAWAAMAAMTLILWCHGNAGGWQYSYRYAMVLLPWIVLILCQKLESIPRWVVLPLLTLSVAVNGWATFLFYWTDRVQP